MGSLVVPSGASIPNTANIFLTPLPAASLVTVTLDVAGMADGLTLNAGQRLVGGPNNASGNNSAVVGGNISAGTGSANGWKDDIRITKGVARSITAAPTAAFPDYREVQGTGALASAAATIAGTGAIQGTRTGTGALAADPASIAGTGTVVTLITGTGELAAGTASVAGTGAVVAPTVITGTGAIHPALGDLVRTTALPETTESEVELHSLRLQQDFGFAS